MTLDEEVEVLWELVVTTRAYPQGGDCGARAGKAEESYLERSPVALSCRSVFGVKLRTQGGAVKPRRRCRGTSAQDSRVRT